MSLPTPRGHVYPRLNTIDLMYEVEGPVCEGNYLSDGQEITHHFGIRKLL